MRFVENVWNPPVNYQLPTKTENGKTRKIPIHLADGVFMACVFNALWWLVLCPMCSIW